MKILRKLFLICLLISPLFSVTGGNDFSTGLNLAAILNLPSLNSINYLLLTLFFFTFVLVNTNKSYLNVYIVGFILLSFLFFFPRHPTIFALMGMISIYACFVVFMDDGAGLTKLEPYEEKILFRVYSAYLMISFGVHLLLVASGNYYANDRMMGIFKNPNQMGFFIVAFYLLYILKIRKPQGNAKDYILPAILSGLVILTGSRSALAAILAIHLAHFFILRKWGYFALLTVIAILGTYTLVTYYMTSSEVIELVTRRNIHALRDDGNMRLQIFKNIVEHGSPLEILVGQDASIGSNGMIYEQKKGNVEIVWLDNLVNVLMYNWGMVGLLFFVSLLIVSFLRNFPVVRGNFLVVIFVIVASVSFLISDFFPLGFMLVYLKNDLPHEPS